MKTSDKGLLAIAREEAVVLGSYKDSGGVWTIGIGHTASAGAPKPSPGMKLSLHEVIELFRHDIVKYEAGVNKAVKVALAQHEFDALVSFHYNTGAIARASLTKALNKGDRAKAAANFMAWTHDNGRVVKGLVDRRARERAMFESGDYGNVATVPVFDKFPGKARIVSTKTIFEPSTDEPIAPDDAAPHGGASVEIEVVQRRLVALGYVQVGKIDGLWGGMTRGAIAAFKNDRHLTGPALIDQELLDELQEAENEGWRRPISTERRNADAEELGPKLPEVRKSDTAQRVSWWTSLATAIGAVVTAITKSLGDAVSWLEPLKGLVDGVPWPVWVGLAFGGAVLIGFVAKKSGEAKDAAVDAYREGARVEGADRLGG